MSIVYLAARYSRRLELCKYRTALELRGHSVPARWLLGEHQVHGLEAAKAIEGEGPITADQAVLLAEDDVEDILLSDTMIAFTEEPRSPLGTRGGRHIETGIVIGAKYLRSQRDRERKLFLVGPIENVFHALPVVDGRFTDFNGLLAAVDDGKVKL